MPNGSEQPKVFGNTVEVRPGGEEEPEKHKDGVIDERRTGSSHRQVEMRGSKTGRWSNTVEEDKQLQQRLKHVQLQTRSSCGHTKLLQYELKTYAAHNKL